jgi:rod shape-determining protein MreB
MLTYFIGKAVGRLNVFKPDVVVSVPAGITQTERRAVVNAAREAGAREVYVVKEPILASLGAGIPINARSGNMIINMGGGTSEVAVVALGGIVSWASLRVAGNKFDQAISDYVKKKYSLAVGEQTAETVKIEIGAALPVKDKMEYQIRGRDLLSGLPKDITISSNEIAEALNSSLMDIADAVQNVFNNTPPELVADIMGKGIILSGGSAQLHYLEDFFSRFLGVSAYVARDPIFCVAKGTGLILNHLDTYKRTLLTKR